MIAKPMLAASMEDSKGNQMSFKDLSYPLIASIKLDGIRSLRINGKTLSRSFKSIPNLYVQRVMHDLPNGLDGELVTYNSDGSIRSFNEIQSDIMSEDGEPNFKFEIFDYVKDNLNKNYTERLVDLKALILPHYCTIVPHMIINSESELLNYEETVLADGHEGIMVRRPNSPYKCGRATFKSQDLIKIKRFKDSEAVIIGFEEKLHNSNEASKDELGHTKRSSSKDGMIPANTLGTILVKDMYSGLEFGIGTGKGLNDTLKKNIWDNQSDYIGKIINYRFQEIGVKNLPRIPSFQGFRDKRDMQ